MFESISNRKRSGPQSVEAEKLGILNSFAIDLMSIPNVEDLFWYVAQKVVGQLSFVDCVIYQSNYEQTKLTQVAALGDKNPYGRSIDNPLVIPFGKGITGTVAQRREAMIVDDLLQDQSYIADTQPARSEICVPIVLRNRVVGVIDCEHPEIQAFKESDLEILTTVAAMTSAKLDLLEEAERSARRYSDLALAHHQLSEEASNRKVLEAKLFEARNLEALGRLSGQFAHEFNNLLTVIAGNVELLQLEPDQAERGAIITDMSDAAQQGAALIRDMLAFSQRMQLKPQPSNLNQQVRNACELTESVGDIGLELEDDIWPVQVDRQAAETAILNLIMNAREATDDRGRIRISTENVRHGWSDLHRFDRDLQPGRYVRVSVQDNGPGIPESDLQRVFDPFFTTKAVGAGAGLGLSMVLGFMKQSGGTVAVLSGRGQGTTFALYFPATPILQNDLLTISD